MSQLSGVSYAQSLQEAKGHGMAFLSTTVGKVVVAIIVVVVLVIVGYMLTYKGAASAKTSKPDKFVGHSQTSNLHTGGSNPKWHYGGPSDSLLSGPVTNSHNIQSHYHPRSNVQSRARFQPKKYGRRERLTSCPDGMYRQTYTDKNGIVQEAGCVTASGDMAAARDIDDSGDTGDVLNYDVDKTTCRRSPWSDLATSEAQALATVGSYEHNGYGLDRLQAAINSAYDGNTQLTPEQIASMVHTDYQGQVDQWGY